VVHVRLTQLQLRRPRQWCACWLAAELWHQLRLDEFWRERLRVSREGIDWLNILVSYRLIDLGSEWRLHRQWYHRSAMRDLLGRTGDTLELPSLYRCLDELFDHKRVLFSFLPSGGGTYLMWDTKSYSMTSRARISNAILQSMESNNTATAETNVRIVCRW